MRALLAAVLLALGVAASAQAGPDDDPQFKTRNYDTDNVVKTVGPWVVTRNQDSCSLNRVYSRDVTLAIDYFAPSHRAKFWVYDLQSPYTDMQDVAIAVGLAKAPGSAAPSPDDLRATAFVMGDEDYLGWHKGLEFDAGAEETLPALMQAGALQVSIGGVVRYDLALDQTPDAVAELVKCAQDADRAVQAGQQR